MEFDRVDVLPWASIINILIVMNFILPRFLFRVFRFCVSIVLLRPLRSGGLAASEQLHTSSSMAYFWQSFSMMAFSEFDVFWFCHQLRKDDMSGIVVFLLKMMLMFIVKTNKIKALASIVLYMIQAACRATRNSFWRCCESSSSSSWLCRRRSIYFSRAAFWDGAREHGFFSSCTNVFWSSCSDTVTSGTPEDIPMWKKKQQEKRGRYILIGSLLQHICV